MLPRLERPDLRRGAAGGREATDRTGVAAYTVVALRDVAKYVTSDPSRN
jgi:hypothetical protein